MESSLSDHKEIVRISLILSSDQEAVARKEEIYGILELPIADLQDLQHVVFSNASGAYGFFSRVLIKYRSLKGSLATTSSLSVFFEKLNLKSVVDAIRGSVVNTSSKAIWFNVEYPVDSFTGREAALENLHDLVTRNTGRETVVNHISVVSGLGGIGKSQLAKKYAWLHYVYYQGNAIWINAETEDSFRNSIINLLKHHFNIPEIESTDKTDSELLKIVYERFTDRKCLIIFDNVEDFDVLQKLPKSLNPIAQIPHVLITSRKSKWQYGVGVLGLDVLSIEEAVEFVNKCIPHNRNQEAALELVKVLQCLPLALQQAVAYMRTELGQALTGKPIETYLKLFNTQSQQRILNYTNGEELSENEKTTYTTWTVTLKNIKSKRFGKLAIRIMKIISCFAAEDIPGLLFQNLKADSKWFSKLRLFVTGSGSANLEPRENVNGAIALLEKYSMITGAFGLINVHRLVQRVVRLNSGQKLDNVLREGLELLENYTRQNIDLEYKQGLRCLLTQAESVWRHSMKYKHLRREYSQFPSNVCDKLRRDWRRAAQLELARDSESGTETVLGEQNEQKIRTKYNQAQSLFYSDEKNRSPILSYLENNSGFQFEITSPNQNY